MTKEQIWEQKTGSVVRDAMTEEARLEGCQTGRKGQNNHPSVIYRSSTSEPFFPLLPFIFLLSLIFELPPLLRKKKP